MSKLDGDSIECLSPLDPNDSLMATSYFFAYYVVGLIGIFQGHGAPLVVEPFSNLRAP
jgi:hypothetical protein